MYDRHKLRNGRHSPTYFDIKYAAGFVGSDSTFRQEYYYIKVVGL